MKPLISICVPVYNVAAYIERCAHSLLQQTYEPLEFVFVNDASTDDSVALLQAVIARYPDRASQVRILHNDRNHGLAYTRRASIEAAQGEFVLCVDSDDYVETDIVERLYAQVDSDECDMVICIQNQPKEEKLLPEEDLMAAALENRLVPLWGKLIRRSLFDLPSVHFAPEGLDYMEDRMLLLYLCGVVRHVAFVNEPLYHYVLRENSVSADKNDKHFRCLIQYWQLADRYLAEQQLTETYRAVTDRQKISDKIHLLHFCNDFSLCRRYADLFKQEELQRPSLQLSKGKRLTRFFAEHHCWCLWRLYKSVQTSRNK